MSDRTEAGAEPPDDASCNVEDAAVRDAQRALEAALRRLWAVELSDEPRGGG